jgi:hypothetical protein
MYSATQLSKIFNTTPKTIYRKFEHESIKKYIISTQQGKRLEDEGFNEFQLLMSESKVNKSPKQSESSKEDTNNTLEYLKNQIEDLKKDKERMSKEIDQKNDLLINKEEQLVKMINLVEKTQDKILLLTDKQNIQTSEKKSKWKFWKK